MFIFIYETFTDARARLLCLRTRITIHSYRWKVFICTHRLSLPETNQIQFDVLLTDIKFIADRNLYAGCFMLVK